MALYFRSNQAEFSIRLFRSICRLRGVAHAAQKLHTDSALPRPNWFADDADGYAGAESYDERLGQGAPKLDGQFRSGRGQIDHCAVQHRRAVVEINPGRTTHL